MRKIVIVSLHIGYWLLYLLLLMLILVCLSIGTNLKNTPNFVNFRFEIFFTTFAILPAILGFYSFYFILFDRFLLRRKILLLFVMGVIASVVSGVISATVISALHSFRIGPGVFKEALPQAIQITGIIAIIALLNGSVALIMKGFIRWYVELKLKEELAQKNFEMELALVKSQISPHFLFNTLNNIDVLITKNAEKASAYLNQLTDMLRFMLYETKTEKIPLSKELAYIEKYIALQKIRTTNPDFVHFEVLGDASTIQIPPMILIPFVENAFKHAETKKLGNTIKIKLAVNNRTILFECKNGYHEQTDTTAFGGLGNELIKRRLSLLYPNNHTLEIEKREGIYRIKLMVRAEEV
jgi:two-component system, LytTR family, sensor kinase